MSSMRTSRVAACLLTLVLAVATAAPAASAQTHVKAAKQTHV
jgi:hypothetical protein